MPIITGIDIQTVDKHFATVSGIVEDITGDPISNAYVYLDADNSDYNTTTGPDGTFYFSDVFPDNYDISARRIGYYETEDSLVVPPDTHVTGVTVVLNAYNGGAVYGTIKNASGLTLEGAYISFTLASPSLWYSIYSDRYWYL